MIQGMVLSAASQYLMPTPDVSDRNRNSPDSQISDKKNDQTNAVENASRKTSLEMEEKAFEMPESDSEHVREVLNIYGRYISLHKKETLFFLITLTTIIISGALIAAFNSLFLATSSVYRDGPCPSIGPMDCFCGANHTYFSCDTGEIAAFPFDVHSGACFRWIARDITTSDVTTQLGVTTGLLVAFGSIAQAIIRIYLLAFNKRLSIATGIHRIAAKTIGINRDTARTRFCCCNLCWHCSACNLSLFKHPSAVIIVTGIYIATPILMVPGVILLYYYEISVTSLTFVVLVVIATLCVLSIVWIMTQESESSSNIPGGWTDAKNLLQNATMNSKNIANGKVSSGKGFSIPV
ncbi:hypothetical protein I4U23_027371 [Adineta vaga]|nr:hypothetical protein I4U23_027371 [Adineta vaga]